MATVFLVVFLCCPGLILPGDVTKELSQNLQPWGKKPDILKHYAINTDLHL